MGNEPSLSCPGARARILRCASLGLALLLAGCASLTPDGGMSPLSGRVTSELGKETLKVTSTAQAGYVRERVSSLLGKPLSADSAVQIALLNNRGLQAEYNALGISEAAYVEASLPPNPRVTFERIAAGGDLEIERRLIANVLGLLTLPSRSRIARSEFEAARYRAIEATFRLAAETRKSFYRAVAARQTASFLEQARSSADIAATLSRRLGETGAASKLDQARASSFYAEISGRLAQARLDAGLDREALTKRMGLWGTDVDYKLPSQLPNFPAKISRSEDIEAEALRRRVDLIAARLELDALASQYGLTNATRFVSALELAGIANYERKIEEGEKERSHPRGFELELEIPIFDFGGVGVRRAQESYLQAVNRLAEKAINARSDVRASYVRYRGKNDIYRLYQNKVLPLQKIIAEQAQLQYNGMLIDVFDLLTTTRETITSNIEAIEAKRDFLIASVDFQTAIIGGGDGSGRSEGEGGEGGGDATTAAAEGRGH
jgi:outer membrane protein TolC